MSYEADILRIESIVSELERDDLELDRALTLFEEGVQRLKTAAEAVAQAEGKVQQLVENADGSFTLGELGG